ncbi:MAG: metallophosphoesterase family protein [Flavobacteriales bacterium]
MKRIGLLSDTHGYLDEAVFRYLEKCDEIWHAGDIGEASVLEALEAFKPTRIVFGNIDGTELRKRTSEYLRFVCEGMDVWMTHIGGRPGNYATPVRAELKANPPGLFICGHSHICIVKFDEQMGVVYMNPGAAGKHGFHHVRTLLRFEIDNGKIQNLEVVELGKRV